MKEAFEKMTGMPDAWTNPALMVSRNAFIQGWEAALAHPEQEPVTLEEKFSLLLWDYQELERAFEKLTGGKWIRKNNTPQPEQEPVAWFRNEDIFGNQEMEPIFYATKAWDNCQPLYTTPPQRTWVVLTDGDFAEVCQMAERGNYLVAFKRIQEKLKDLNT